MRFAFWGSGNPALTLLFAAVATAAILPAYGATVEIDLDDNPSNGAESRVETNVLQSFPVMIENVVFNNTSGTSFLFDWAGAGPGGFSSILTPGPGVGTKWEWSTVSQVYSISTPGSFIVDSSGIPVFGAPTGGFVTPGGGTRQFTLPGKSIYPGQVTTSTASLTASLITFFSPENTVATCESTFAPGIFTQTITNTSGEDLLLTVEQPDCCLEANQIICNEICRSYLTDVENCGGCGITCEYDEFCDAGTCADICPGEGQEYCDGSCYDTLNDVTNCGGCGITCEYDEFCDAGTCADICPGEGQEYCDGSCYDTLNDVTNCGGCGITCEYDEFCDAGTCADICPGEGQEYCDGSCYDTLNDVENCGGCGIVCAFDEFCDAGTCADICPGEGQEYCDGSCYDTLNDVTNCGGCGIVCAYDEFCDAGTCADICPGEGQEYCDGSCYDTLNDVTNCGGCGIVCAYDEFCDAGTCADICPGEGQAYCNGTCVDLLNDPLNCGGCGNDCDVLCGANSDTCSLGSCICDDEGDDSVAGAAASAYPPPVWNELAHSAPGASTERPARTPTSTRRMRSQTTKETAFKPVVERLEPAPIAPPPLQTPVATQPLRAPTATRPTPATAGREPTERYAPSRGMRRTEIGEASKSVFEKSPGRTAASTTVEEAPICEFQEPIEQVIPDGESYTQCQTGALLGMEVFTRASIIRDGELLGVGPCAVVIPATEIVLDDFYATTTSIVVVDESGDGLLQPGEQADLYLGLLNVGPLELMDPIATLSGPPDQFNPSEVTVLGDTAYFPDFPQFENVADCETPPVLEPQTNLTPFTIVMSEEQESDVARALRLTIEGGNAGPVTFEMPIIIGIGEKCDPTNLDGESYDGLDGFLNPLDVKLVPRGNPVNYSNADPNKGSNVPLKLKLKCGNNVLRSDEIDPNPKMVSIVHETLGAQPIENINASNNSNPDDPFFVCGTSRCEFGLRTEALPVGRYVIGIEMADSRVFEAGFTLRP